MRAGINPAFVYFGFLSFVGFVVYGLYPSIEGYTKTNINAGMFLYNVHEIYKNQQPVVTCIFLYIYTKPNIKPLLVDYLLMLKNLAGVGHQLHL